MTMAQLSYKSELRIEDERLFGWDPTPGIVSVWANREGRAVVWRREDERVLCTQERFRPWCAETIMF
jgi:DNA polymerase, archaea type